MGKKSKGKKIFFALILNEIHLFTLDEKKFNIQKVKT